MGWVAAILVAIATFVGLRVAGVSRRFGLAVGAALALGAAGYAWQQNAGLPGRPVRAESVPVEVDPGLVAFRAAILPAPPESERALATADAALRRGATSEAVAGLLAAIRRAPGDAALWTGLGSAFVAHDGGQMSPSAQFAFRRAWQLAPRAPGPPFFLGIAYVQAGDLAAAKTAWLRALALAPRDAPWRVAIAERLVVIDEFQAMTRGAPMQGGAPQGGDPAAR